MRLIVFVTAALTAGYALIAAAAGPSTDLAASFKLEWVRDMKAESVPAGSVAIVAAKCPTGKFPLSGGFVQSASPGKWQLASSYPLNDSWRVEMRNTASTGTPSELYVWALCGSGVPKASLTATPAAPALSVN